MLKQVSEHCYYLPNSYFADRPALGYVKGEKYSLMIDAGNSPKRVAEFWAALAAAGLKKPDFVAITHYHWDHTFGLQAIDAVSIAGKKTNEWLKRMATWDWSEEAMAERQQSGEEIEFCNAMLKKEYPDRSQILVKTADVVIDGSFRLDLGGVTCEAMPLTNSHSADSIIYYIPEDKLLYSGDALYECIHTEDPCFFQDKHKKMLEELDALDIDLIVDSHRPPQSKAERFVELNAGIELFGLF